MTKTENTTDNHNTLHIPSREEFHRYASNLISENDFIYPGRSIQQTASALRWTVGHAMKNY